MKLFHWFFDYAFCFFFLVNLMFFCAVLTAGVPSRAVTNYKLKGMGRGTGVDSNKRRSTIVGGYIFPFLRRVSGG